MRINQFPLRVMSIWTEYLSLVTGRDLAKNRSHYMDFMKCNPHTPISARQHGERKGDKNGTQSYWASGFGGRGDVRETGLPVLVPLHTERLSHLASLNHCLQRRLSSFIGCSRAYLQSLDHLITVPFYWATCMNHPCGPALVQEFSRQCSSPATCLV